ncbi:uncharacterized protein LOC116262911 [Nymphaea colorata]|nr:uncharacterized protein LOC116262911 [Nymphaea colorata]
MAEEEGTGELSISLRPFEIEDADDVMAWKGDPRVAAFCRWHPYTSCDEAVAFIQDFAIHHEWCRAICVPGRPVECISVTIMIMPGAKGVATSAVRLAVPAVFREFSGMERVEAMVIPEDKRPIRVLEKCGFLREGILRKYVVGKDRLLDLVMFSVLSKKFNHDQPHINLPCFSV